MAISNGWRRPGQQEETLERLTKEIAKGGGTAFVGQSIGKGINFLLQILLARVLRTGDYGLYALGHNVLGVTQTLSMLGLHNGVVRFGSMYRGQGDRSRLKGTCLATLTVSLNAALVVSALLFLFSDLIATRIFNEPALASVLRVFSVSLPFYTLMTAAAHSARAFRRMEYDVGVQNVFHPLTNLIAVGVVFLLGFRLMGAVYGFLISSASAAGLGIYLLSRVFPDLISDIKPNYELRRLLSYSLTVLLVGVSHLLLVRTDRIVLGIFSVAKDVGIYNAAMVVGAQTAVFLGAFNAIFSPIIASLYHQDHMAQLGNLFKITTKWIFGLTLPTFLIFVLFSKQIMGLFGAEFPRGWVILVILASAQFLNASAGSVGFLLTMTGRHRTELVNSLVLGGLNVLLSIILVQKHGILGVALATGLSLVLINITRLVEVHYLYHIHPYNASYWKPIMAGVLATVAGAGMNRFLEFNGCRFWLLGVVLFGFVYILVLILLGLDEEDKIVLRAVKERLMHS